MEGGNKTSKIKLGEEKVWTLAEKQKLTKECDKIEKAIDLQDFKNQEQNSSDNACDKNHRWKTCDFSSLPKWLQANRYILRGYRPPLPSFHVCFFSIFRIHTETVNIWSHLVGFILFVVLFLHIVLSSLPLQDKLLLSPFLSGALFCLGLSSTYHTVECHSQTILLFFNHLDYCGVALLNIGIYVSWFYYIFFCDIKVQIFYLTGTLILGTCAIIVSLSKSFSQPSNRWLRVTVFAISGLSGIIPVAHFILIDGWDGFIIVTPLFLTGFFYFVGGVVYAMRIPEKIFPGKCDILFQSHQVFHVLVLLGTIINYIGIVRVVGFAQFGRNNPDFCQQKLFYYKILQDSFYKIILD